MGILTFGPKTIKYFRRYREIAKIMTSYGLLNLLDYFGVNRFFSSILGIFFHPSRKIKKLPIAVRLRMSFEKLGPAFIKLGQLASTRPDLVPQPFIIELEKLQDEVTPTDFLEIRKIVEEELKSPINNMFIEFEETPIASASIGQVHRAILNDGSEVVVKVKKPGVDTIVETDLDVLVTQSKFLNEYTIWAKDHNLLENVLEFKKLLTNELDYTFEGRNIERFRNNFSENEHVIIPSVYWDHTTRNILTMERVKGIKLSDNESLSEVGFNTKRITHIGAEMYMQMIFIDGFFHADPHPGNLMVIDEDKIGLVDFGMVGIMTKEMKKHASNLFIALVDRDANAIAEIFDEMGALPEETNLRAFIREINDMMLRYYDIRLKQFRMAELLNEFIKIVVRFRFALPFDLTLLLKTLIELEGVGEKLDPDFNIIEIGKEYATKLTAQAFNPLTWGPEFMRDVKDLTWTLRRIPNQISSVLEKADNDKLRLNMNISGFNELITTIRRTIDQLDLSILIASFVVGSAFIVVSARLLPRYVILMAFAVLVPAALLSLWLVISILRRRG